jgi:IS30 family transposase
VLTLTSDNGKEFAGHAEISEKLGLGFYFCTPYHSWERGLNENTNGLVRQYFPKGTDFTKLTAKDVQRVEDLLNNRPRKALNYHSPNEVFAKLTAPPQNYALGI